ncbi:DUF1294 domain-containing protein [Aminipila luticellarii]|uniref:DUF1294 domain-containing protein n=1 Tax=Aminipila luticellarii TaxID=2507160 RepID=A0A410PYI2_9FIRM|nr:DUF1294 domain-containing protein [Aminipila luticellarii]QAT44021.1 DUF1294 domain-containing protein [Aminipila luticellarii]
MKYTIVVYIIWNVVAFAVMGIDKYKAQNNKWRISEATLLSIAFLMGGVGSMIGSQFFRHKTKKTKFKILLPISVLCNAVILFLVTGGKSMNL